MQQTIFFRVGESMQTISKEQYSKLLKDSVELQKVRFTVSKLTGILKEKVKIVKDLQDSLRYYKKLSQKDRLNPSVSDVNDWYYIF